MVIERMLDAAGGNARAIKVLWAVALLGLAALAGVAVFAPDLPRDGLDRATATIGPMLSDRLGTEITDPIRISSEPDVVIVSGRISSGSPLDVLVSEAHASAVPVGELVITSPEVLVRSGGASAGPHPASPSSSLSALLAARSVGRVRVDGGTLRLERAIGRDIVLSGIDAAIDLASSRDVARLSGKLELLGQPFGFELSLDTRPAGDGSAGRALSLRLSGVGVEGAFDGSFDYRDGLQQTGVASLRFADFGAFVERMGIGAASAIDLTEVYAEGGMTLSAGTLALTASRIGTEASRATGSISVRLDGERPVIDGTLDFKMLDIDGLAGLLPWRRGEHARENRGSLPVALGEIDEVDADLRVSAERLVVGGLETGPFAATVTVRDGSLAGNIAELSLFGGSAAGQLTVETGERGRIALGGALRELRFSGPVADLLGIDPGPGSHASLSGDLTAVGESTDAWLDSLAGTIKLKLAAGTIRESGLLAAAAMRIDEGLRGQSVGTLIPGRPLSIDALSADIGIGGGRAKISNLALTLAGEELLGAGEADLRSGGLNLSIWPDEDGEEAGTTFAPRHRAIALEGEFDGLVLAPASGTTATSGAPAAGN